MEFLGMIVSQKGLEMYKDKVQAIQEWPILKTIKEVQAFLGFANFDHQFILRLFKNRNSTCDINPKRSTI